MNEIIIPPSRIMKGRRKCSRTRELVGAGVFCSSEILKKKLF